MESRKLDKGFIVSVRDVNGILESDKSKETGRIALGFEVKETLSVRGPNALDAVSKPPAERRKPKALAGAPRKIGLMQLEAQGIFLPEKMGTDNQETLKQYIFCMPLKGQRRHP